MELERRYTPLLLTGALFLLVLLITVVTVVTITDGHLVYALDDPYIHLALARQVAHGHYGLNPGEVAAPASSILYPFLLAPFVRAGVGLWAPLAWNTLAAVGSLCVLWLLLDRGLRGLPETRRQRWTGLILVLSIASFNLIGQALEGMEHLLQLWMSLLALWGVRRLEDEARLPRWLPLVLVLGPLLRYENLMVSLLGIAYLLWRGQRRGALQAAIGLALTLGGFTLFLKTRGLGPLPTSVMAKSVGTNLGALRANLDWNLIQPAGQGLRPEGQCLLLAAVLALGLAGWRRGREGALLALLGSIPLVHLIVGAVGFGRYETYALALAGTGSLLVLVQIRRGALLPLAPALLLGIGQANAMHTLAAVKATRFVYEQQYQMARFVRDYARVPVAVNDIGLVAYQGEQYVLDLWGLACKEVLEKRRTQPNHTWMQELAAQRGIRLVLIYDWWFGRDIPAGWVKVGELYLSAPGVYLGGNIVSIYVTNPDETERMREKLAAFRATLPAGVTLIRPGEQLPG